MQRLRRLEARVLELEQRLPANHPQACPCWTGMLSRQHISALSGNPLTLRLLMQLLLKLPGSEPARTCDFALRQA